MPVPPNRKGQRRRRPRQALPETPTPTAPVLLVEPNAIYRPEAVRTALGLQASSLRREIRLGRLKVSKVSGRYLIRGAQLLAWLDATTYTPPDAADPKSPAAGP